MAETRGAAWILTSTGRRFWPLDPRPEDVCLEDIAHHLSMQCRFTGATRFHYSVAQHSVLVSRCAPAGEDALWGLLHDAAEAYLVDVARPLKKTPGFGAYREAEARVMAAICERFGLPRAEPAWVAKADVVLLATEWRDVMPPQLHLWSESDPMFNAPTPMPERIEPWSPAEAEERFLDRFWELEQAQAPFICPGCQAVDDEPHAGYCPDAAIEREHRERIESGDYDRFDDEDSDG